MRWNPHGRFLRNESEILQGTYINFYSIKPLDKKPTFLWLQGLFQYKIQSKKYSAPFFLITYGFNTFQNLEQMLSGTMREQQLVDLAHKIISLDLGIIIDVSLVEWKELRGRRAHWQ